MKEMKETTGGSTGRSSVGSEHDQSNLCYKIIFSKPCVPGPSCVQLEAVRSAQVVEVAADEG